MALQDLHVDEIGQNQPEDPAALDAWGRAWLSKHGYTFRFRSAAELEELAGTIARMWALRQNEATVKEMRRLAAPHKHPSLEPPSDPVPAPVQTPAPVAKRGRRKEKMLKLRVGEEELSAWRSLAERHNRSLSDLVRGAVHDELEFDQAAEVTSLEG